MRGRVHLSSGGNVCSMWQLWDKRVDMTWLCIDLARSIHHKQHTGDISVLLLTNYYRHQRRGGDRGHSVTDSSPTTLPRCLWAAGEVAPGVREHMAEDTDYLAVRGQREGGEAGLLLATFREFPMTYYPHIGSSRSHYLPIEPSPRN